MVDQSLQIEVKAGETLVLNVTAKSKTGSTSQGEVNAIIHLFNEKNEVYTTPDKIYLQKDGKTIPLNVSNGVAKGENLSGTYEILLQETTSPPPPPPEGGSKESFVDKSIFSEDSPIDNIYYDEALLAFYKRDITQEGYIIVVINKTQTDQYKNETWSLDSINGEQLIENTHYIKHVMPTKDGFVIDCKNHYEIHFKLYNIFYKKIHNNLDDDRIWIFQNIDKRPDEKKTSDLRDKIPSVLDISMSRKIGTSEEKINWKAKIDLSVPDYTQRPSATWLCGKGSDFSPTLIDTERPGNLSSYKETGYNGTLIAKFKKGYSKINQDKVVVEVVEKSPLGGFDSLFVEASFDGKKWNQLQLMGRLIVPAGSSTDMSIIWRFRGSKSSVIDSADDRSGFSIRVRDNTVILPTSRSGLLSTAETSHVKFRDILSADGSAEGADIHDAVVFSSLKFRFYVLLDFSGSMINDGDNTAGDNIRDTRYTPMINAMTNILPRLGQVGEVCARIFKQNRTPIRNTNPQDYTNADTRDQILSNARSTGWQSGDNILNSFNDLIALPDIQTQEAGTPLAEAIETIETQLSNTPDDTLNYVLILSDGIHDVTYTNPADVRDPEAVMRDISARQMPEKIYVLGLALSTQEKIDLKKIVAADSQGRTEDLDVANIATDLQQEIDKAVNQILANGESAITEDYCPTPLSLKYEDRE